MIQTMMLAACLVSPAQAAVHSCRGNLTIRMTGDLFAPIECSTAAVTALPLSIEAVVPAKTDLTAFAGVWKGTLIQSLYRYELSAAIKPGRSGKAEASLALREMQMGERVEHRLTLAPAKGKGRYSVAASSDRLKGEALKGDAVFGLSVSTPTAPGVTENQLDVVFANGASHRIRFTPDGKDSLRLQVWSTIPGWPLRSFETVLRRSARQR